LKNQKSNKKKKGTGVWQKPGTRTQGKGVERRTQFGKAKDTYQ